MLQLSPVAAPLLAVLALTLWPAAWQPLFGKETLSEHVTHALLCATSLLFLVSWRRLRVPGLGLLSLGTLLVLVEEIDYGYVYFFTGYVDHALHNSIVVVWLLLAAEACFAVLPFVLRDAPLRWRRWFPVTRACAVAVGGCAVLLVLAQFTDAEVDGYPISEGADEVHDLGVALALFALALRPPELGAGAAHG